MNWLTGILIHNGWRRIFEISLISLNLHHVSLLIRSCVVLLPLFAQIWKGKDVVSRMVMIESFLSFSSILIYVWSLTVVSRLWWNKIYLLVTHLRWNLFSLWELDLLLLMDQYCSLIEINFLHLLYLMISYQLLVLCMFIMIQI